MLPPYTRPKGWLHEIEEIKADILALEKETDGLLQENIGKAAA